MSRRVSADGLPRIDSFDLAEGRRIGGKYVVERKLGGGYEGEVYKVTESKTGVSRAAKLFYPHRNPRDRAVTTYAKKLEKLKRCEIVIQYHHSETLRVRGQKVTSLVSEYVEGELLSRFLARQPRKRLPPFEAMHLVHALATGLEDIHALGEYHGDLHDDNVMVNRRGIHFDLKVVDLYNRGRPTARHIRDDVIDVVRILYDLVGGKKHYRSQPPEIKTICKGLRRELIGRAFPTAGHLRDHLDAFAWST